MSSWFETDSNNFLSVAMTQVASFGPLCPLNHGGQQYLCYICPKDGAVKIHVTNAVDLWSADVTKEAMEEQKYRSGTTSTEDYSMKFREAFDHGNASLALQDGRAHLNIKNDNWAVTYDLFKQPISEAKAQVQALLFSLVDRASSLEKQLHAAEGAAAAASASPEKLLSKTQRMLMPGIDSRKGGRGGLHTTVVKRVPGESLINPGFKRKKAATGVDFEEP
ncbi:protein PAXX [Ambystoma mexicanum]|uniref:protein PAXX n=1 Tax=Ambystoma mexicanum TaxID=8296 RepID=UPI0037E7E438